MSFWAAPVAEPPTSFPKSSPVSQPTRHGSFPPNVHDRTVHKGHIHTAEPVMPRMLHSLLNSSLKSNYMVIKLLLHLVKLITLFYERREKDIISNLNFIIFFMRICLIFTSLLYSCSSSYITNKYISRRSTIGPPSHTCNISIWTTRCKFCERILFF